MEQKSKLSDRFKGRMKEIRDNSVLNCFSLPTITMFGNREFFAEGKITVEKYTDTEIVLCINTFTARILGRGLSLCFYSRKNVKASGYITDLSFDCSEGP